MVSIIMLSYNAIEYTKHSLKTLRDNTKNIQYEIIVLDNNSNVKTKDELKKLKEEGYIDKLIFEKENTLFAKGNNIASSYCSDKSKYILLLNSDVEIRNPKWLELLISNYKKGAIAYGVCIAKPHTRADGYCFLIDKDLYKKYKLDEKFEWWWSVTKLQAQLLRDGYNVSAISNHNDILYHYGGMSGKSWKNAKGMEIEGEQVSKWFHGNIVNIIHELPINKNENRKYLLFNLYHFINKNCNKIINFRR